MHELQLQQLVKLIKLMDALGCVYKIITPDGKEFGSLQVQTTPQRRKGRYPRGELRNFYRKQINQNAAIGEIQIIEPGPYPIEMIRGGVGSMLNGTWGPGSYVTSIKNKCVELLRIA